MLLKSILFSLLLIRESVSSNICFEMRTGNDGWDFRLGNLAGNFVAEI